MKEFSLNQKEEFHNIAEIAKKRLSNIYPKPGPYIHWFNVLTWGEIQRLRKMGW